MSLLEKASLVVTPNAYKESKLYSVIPNTTLGDMDVVRATTATRVNEQGLIEVVPRNLLTYSNDFTNAAWNKDYAIITPNATTSPDGTNNGTKLIGKNINDIQILYRTLTVPNGNTVFSFYVKKAEYSKAGIRLGGTANNATIAFDLDLNAIIYQAGSILSSQIIDLSNDWKRIILTVNITNEFAAPCVFGLPNSGYTWDAGNLPIYTGNGTSGIYIYGAQLEQGSTATTYFPTTTRLNIPRIDYTNGSCPSLLVEPQRTNLITYSEQFDNAAWSNTNLTINPNTINSPSGNITADTFTTLSTTTENQVRYGNFSIISNVGNSYTTTVFAKKGTNNFLRIRNLFVENGGTLGNAWFNLNTGVVGTIESSQIASIQNMGNGWYRCSLTGIVGSSSNFNLVDIGISDTNGVTFPSSNINAYLWGAQLEAGSYATSYIPTVASTSTRNADVISKTGISSLIGQTEGTLFVQCNLQDSIPGQAIATLYENSNNVIILYKQNDNVLKCFVVTSGVLQINLGFTSVSGNIKIAVAYKTNDFVLYINGTLIDIDTSGSVPTCSNLYLGADADGAQKMFGTINQAQLYKTRLTNTELAQLTTI